MFKIRLIKTIVCLTLLVKTSSLIGTTYYVNDASSTGNIYCNTGATGNDATGTGTAALPYRTLTKAISVASNGDIILIDVGNYGHQYNSGTDRGITINKAVTINGAGTANTIFDDNHSGTTGHYFALITASATLYNFSILNYGGDGSYGQAITISNSGSTPTVNLNNIQVTGCGGGAGYGAILINTSTNVNINGGGSTCNGSGSWTYSGGIDIVGSSVNASITNYEIISNYTARTTPYGAALSITSGAASTIVALHNCRITGNNYDVSSGDGGAIYMTSGNLFLYDCIVSSNIIHTPSATNAGVGIAVEGGNARFTRSLFQSNSGASTYGGAIAATSVNAALTLTIDSCKFTGNSSAKGADLYTKEVFSRAVTVNSTNSTYSSSGTNIFQNGSGTITLDKCGSPTTSGTVTFTNTTAPTYTANPTVPSYSGSCATAIIIMPVELINFNSTCENEKTKITWQTATEENNDFFTLEKSSDGYTFSSIATIKGAGNSQSLKNYSYLDSETTTDEAYYRLSQTDLNGSRKQFEVIYFQSDCNTIKTNIVNLYPNPATNEFTLQLNLKRKEFIEVTLYDCFGRIVKKVLSGYYQEGLNSNKVSIAELSSGVYIVETKLSGQVTINKVVKQD